MTEQNQQPPAPPADEQNQQPPAPPADEQKATQPGPAITAPSDVDAETSTGYAVYDETLQRFVSGVLEKKADADKAAKAGPKGHTLKVRKV